MLEVLELRRIILCCPWECLFSYSSWSPTLASMKVGEGGFCLIGLRWPSMGLPCIDCFLCDGNGFGMNCLVKIEGISYLDLVMS